MTQMTQMKFYRRASCRAGARLSAFGCGRNAVGGHHLRRVGRREVRRADARLARGPAVGDGRSLRLQARAREAAGGRVGDDGREGLGRERPQDLHRDQEGRKPRTTSSWWSCSVTAPTTATWRSSTWSGPDLTAKDWTDLLAGVQGRLARGQHHRGQLPVSRVADRQGPRRDHRHRFGGAEVRDRVSRVLRQGRSAKRRPISTRTAAPRCSKCSRPPAPP